MAAGAGPRILSPGDPLAPDPNAPGACLPGNYARVTFLTLDPARPHALYVGTDGALGDGQDGGCGGATGGLFYRATSAGAFLPLNRGLPANRDARGDLAWGVRALTVAPLYPRTLYLATDPSFRAYPGGARTAAPSDPGLYRSTDGGLHWQPALAGIAGTPCPPALCRYPGSLAIDTTSPGLLLYAADTGLYRSLDGGSHWTLQATLDVGDRTHLLARIDPYHPGLAYVVTDRAIYRSADRGLHLTRLIRADLPNAAAITDLRFELGRADVVVFLLRGGGRVRLLDAQPAAPSRQPTGTSPAPAPAAGSVPKVGPTPIPSAGPTPAASAPGRQLVPASDWPMPGHDPGQSYALSDSGFLSTALPAFGLRWQRSGSVPAIALGGKVYAIDASSGQATAYAARDGTLAHRYRSTGVRGLAAAAGVLYINRGGEIRIVDLSTAAWHFTAVGSGRQGTAGSIGAIIAAGSSIFAGVAAQAGVQGRAYGFDARTGRLLWAHPSGATSTPCLAVGTLFLSAGPPGAADSMLIDPTTGAVRRTLKGYGTAQWHTAGPRIYAGVLRGATGQPVLSIDAYDTQGRYRWTARGISFGAASADLVVGVAPGAAEGRSAIDGHRLWRTSISSVRAGFYDHSVLLAGSMVIVQSADGAISVLDAASGRLLRVLRPVVPATGAADLLAASGMIYESVTYAGAGGAARPVLLAFGA